MEKTITRNCAKFIRTKIDIQAISKELVARIRGLKEYQEAKTVLLFYPKDGEVNLTSLVYDKGKQFCLPRMEEGAIVPCCWNCDDELKLSQYDIYEPCTNETPTAEIDLIIMPGLCADKNRNRLGYGKGCYDFFLTKCDAVTVFPLPDELLFNNIPSAQHDIKPDIIITPTQIIR